MRLTKLIYGRTLMIFIFALTIGCQSSQKMATIDPASQQEVDSLAQDLAVRKAQNHDLLSPDSYEKAKDYFEKANDQAQEGEPYSTVLTTAKKSRSYFDAIDKHLKVATFHLEDVLRAREEALVEGANKLKSFQKADKRLKSLGEDIEDNDITEVLKEKGKVAQMYVNSEIEAIKKREVGPIKNRMEQALDTGPHRSFKKTRATLEAQIKSAEVLISQNKDEPDRYLPAVEKADYISKIFLARRQMADWVDKTSPEQVSLRLEKDLNIIGLHLGYSGLRDEAYPNKIALITKESSFVPVLRNELSDSRLTALRSSYELDEVRMRKQEIGAELQRSRDLQAKIDFVNEMFEPDEAELLIRGNDLIIRLIGINFAFNQAELPPNSDRILSKVQEAIDKFGSPSIEIQGHTDATGPSDYNLNLSKKRALTVRKYLVEKGGLPKAKIVSQGYGYKRPVVDNKYSKNRKLNRRIDVVLESVVK